MRKANYRLPAYLLVLMNILGFGLLYMANDYRSSVLMVGAGMLGIFILIY